MDISVRHLNNRLALQLPAELPLGLVFVVGTVENLSPYLEPAEAPNADSSRADFELLEEGHRLRCRLSKRVALEIKLQEGDRIRVGGHLSFDTHRADYFLLARDVEMIEEVPNELYETELPLAQIASPSILEDIRRRSARADIPRADLPGWVQRIAPPEVQGEMSEAELDEAGERRSEIDAAEAEVFVAKQEEPDEATIAFIAEAMDQDEEIELKPEMVPELRADVAGPMPRLSGRPYDVPAPEAQEGVEFHEVQEKSRAGDQAQRHISQQRPPQADWMLILFIISFIVVVLTALAVVIILWLR